MRLKFGLVITGVLMALLMVSCVPSQNPLYTDKDVVENPEFVGVWHGEAMDVNLTVTKGPEKSYILAFPPAGAQESTTTLSVHLVKLGEKMFMDAVNQTDASEDPALKAAHYFSKVDIQPDTLAITMLNDNWMKAQIDQNTVQIAHEMKGEKVFLTAPTEELQKLVLKYVDDEAAFPNPSKYQRVK